MKDTDLFTQAAAAREMGVTSSAVDFRRRQGNFRPNETTEIGGKIFFYRRGLKRWKREREEKQRPPAVSTTN